MKILTIWALSIILLYSPPLKVEASNTIRDKAQLNYLEIKHVIEFLQPNIKDETKIILANALHKISIENKVDWRIYLAVLKQESSLRVDPWRNGKRCVKRYKQCHDFGIGQVSYHYWGKKLKLNRKKALTDAKYSISLSKIVYIHYFNKYNKRDKKWYTRYHSGTPSLRKKYEKRINSHYGKIVVAQKQFRRLLLSVQRQENKHCIAYYNEKQ